MEPAQPFLGTVRLDALAYANVDLKRYYPYGDPDLSVRAALCDRSQNASAPRKEGPNSQATAVGPQTRLSMAT